MQVALDAGVAPGEAGLVVADVVDRAPREMREQVGGHALRPAGLAGQDHAVGRHHRLAGDARVRIGGEIGVQNRVADAVGHLVGMAFGDRFGCEQELAGIAHGFPSCRARPPDRMPDAAVCGGKAGEGQADERFTLARQTPPPAPSHKGQGERT